MIITPDFVYIHQPKTGGSFVTRVLQSLYPQAKTRDSFITRALQTFYPERNNIDPQNFAMQNYFKHGTCSDIPTSCRDLPILGCVRNPFERYVSQYEFAWWKKELPQWSNLDEIYSIFPHFPELSFEEFVTGSDVLLQRFQNKSADEGKQLGLQTEQFIRYYFRDPSIFERIDDRYLSDKQYTQDMYPVTFLRTNTLNNDLYTYLMQYGFTETDLAFIHDARRERPHET